jgi:hypothetical protein
MGKSTRLAMGQGSARRRKRTGDHARSALPPHADSRPCRGRRRSSPRHTSLRSASCCGWLVLWRQCHQPGHSRRGVRLAPHLHLRHPRPARFPGEDLGWIDADPHVLLHPDGKFVLDNDLWLKDEGETFPEEVRKHFSDHPRRSVTRATHGAQPQAAWETTPTTVLIGQRDNMLSEADRKWAEAERCARHRHRPFHHLPASRSLSPS